MLLNYLLRAVILSLLWLRYRITVRGLSEVTRRGTRGILFLPTHPALIDPIILTALLLKRFQARPFVNQDAVDMPGIRWLVAHVRALKIPPISRYGPEAIPRIEAMVAQSIEALRNGENLILYPAGYLLNSRFEVVGGNSAVETILRALPDVRIVLARTRGLWGSSFSTAYGKDPDVGGILRRGIRQILANFVFFTPRRRVDVYFYEPDDFPRAANRAAINAYLERFYNENAPPALYVPYTIWERGGRHEVPAATRAIVLERLRTMTGVTTIHDADRLASDLGMDSLARAELLAWMEEEFGFPQGNSDSLLTVTDALLAAVGEGLAKEEVALKLPPAGWFVDGGDRLLAVPPGETIAACFLLAARRAPGQLIVADQASGARTYRELVMGVLALLPDVQALPGEKVGIMLPASVAACLAYLTTLFAGRTPVLINWTVGRRNILHGVEVTGTQRIITAKALVARLEKQGLHFAELAERFVYLEDLAAGMSRGRKLRAWLGSHLHWRALQAAQVAPTAAILFTSGSESLPKAVPLSHSNVLTDIREVLPMAKLVRRDRLLAMLPPFHSFGLTGNLAMPLITGMRAVYHPNPAEGPVLAKVVEAYRATVILGTPTFLYGMLRAATKAQLASLRLAIAGAEECPRRVYEMAAERCPRMTLIEGYGITECSPIVAVNIPEDPRPHTIGRLLPSLEAVVLDVDTGKPAAPGTPGMLLLRGPTIFAGYLGEAPDPFVEYDGKRWYRTGDLVRRGADGAYIFAGRLQRFVKLGGEMISLPAIESALLETYGAPEDEGPMLAVLATTDEYPELVLFTVKAIERETANAAIRAAGLSPLHHLRRVQRVPAIPVLGTGKTDYRALQASMQTGRDAH